MKQKAKKSEYNYTNRIKRAKKKSQAPEIHIDAMILSMLP